MIHRTLYEFTARICVSTVIAAPSEAAARKEIASWGKGAWLANGDAEDEVSDVHLFDIREPRSQNDDAHVIVS